MIGLLGRAGLLSEAKSLIEKMDTEPDAIIWRSLLSACLAHSDAQLAEVAGKEIIRKEPDDDGVYVLLWNMYASSNRWEEALEMRKKMWNRKVVKQPGCSWIEVDGFVHEFLVEDRTHHLRSEIYVLLEGMAKQLKMDSNISMFDENDPGDFFLDPELFI
ncbi:PPR repeat [Musa troglodytarum]|nr:PPR repeat [Musa troglodytarum]